MKISGFSFMRNCQDLFFPYIHSIKSILPICDEFIVVLGESQDNSYEALNNLARENKKVKVFQSVWNESMREKGYVYAQQKTIAQYLCSGDWLFYLEADEVVHESDISNIMLALEKYNNDSSVEVLAFKYNHFYGALGTIISSPSWYRFAPRIIKASVRSFSPDALYWLVMDQKKSNRRARYPRGKVLDAYIYHYGWVRPELKMNEKINQNSKYWGDKNVPYLNYANVDPQTLCKFQGQHPKGINDFFSEYSGNFCANPNHRLTSREIRQRVKRKIEKLCKVDLSRKHFKEI